MTLGMNLKKTLQGGSERPHQLSPVLPRGQQLPNNLSPGMKAGILKPVKAPSGGVRNHSIVSGSDRHQDLSTPVKGLGAASNMSH